MLQEISGPRRGCCQLTEESEKRGLGSRFRGLAQDKLPLPIAPWSQVSRGPLEFRRCTPVGQERWRVCSQKGECKFIFWLNFWKSIPVYILALKVSLFKRVDVLVILNKKNLCTSSLKSILFLSDLGILFYKKYLSHWTILSFQWEKA